MNSEFYIKTVVDSIVGFGPVKVENMSKYKYQINNGFLKIDFLFEKYEEGVTIMLSDMSNTANMHLYLLCFLKKIKLFDLSNAKEFSDLLKRHFKDFLGGDFSIQKDYMKYEKDFFDLLCEIHMMEENNPIKVKFKNFDISWLKDIK